ncbi:MAG: four helix bundle protein [Chloroflexi bacterium]|nr:four helix bundle protein [Chloroflexota bacterium]
MATITRFEEIEAWQTARDLTRLVYSLTRTGGFSRDYALSDQIRRAAISIMSNIAEGYESRTQALFVDYLGRAKASAGELRAQSYIALDVGYLDESQFADLFPRIEKCSRQLNRFIAYLESRPNSRQLREETVAYEL